MLVAPLSELVDDDTILMPFTVDQYHWMIDQGILPEGEPYELIDGCIVRKDRSAAGESPMTIGVEHAVCVNKLMRLNPKFEKLGSFLQVQQPVTLPPYDEPQPDGSVVVGRVEDFTGHLPGAADVTCVIEVADSSLQRDRTTKLRVYAESGIPLYVIINLPDRVVEVYTQPLKGKGRYGRSETLTSKQTLELPAGRGKRVSVAVRSLLP